LGLEVEELLRSRGVKYRLIELRGRAVGTEDVVKQAVGYVEASEVCKTVLLKGGSGRLYAALVLGNRRVSLSKVSEEVGEPVRLASREELAELGLEPGAVSPLTVDAELLVDEEVMVKGKANFSSGHPLYGLEMDPRDLAKLRRLRVAKLTVEG